MTRDLRAVEDAAIEDIARGWYRGVQLFVAVDGECVLECAHGVDGTDRPIGSDSLHVIYCASKPLLAVGMAVAVEAGLLRLDDTVGMAVPGLASAAFANVTLRQVLNHSAGLIDPSAEHAMVTPADRRPELVATARLNPAWILGEHAAYSEYAGWQVLRWALEHATGTRASTFVRDQVLAPLGIADGISLEFGSDDYRAARDRIAVQCRMDGERVVPLLLERTARAATEPYSAMGAWATTAALGRFYVGVSHVLAGRASDLAVSGATLREWVRPSRPVAFDPALGRECTFGLGFMVDLRRHDFGGCCSEESFGHSGRVGATFAFSDPAAGLVVACTWNGNRGGDAEVTVRRPLTVAAVYAAAIGDRAHAIPA
ncbi:MAG: serine hydrolase domain-containing protein [Actinomycetota bacterium]|nr:serine hydrolase domain-containing protein [Actinomycetota bacterium]